MTATIHINKNSTVVKKSIIILSPKSKDLKNLLIVKMIKPKYTIKSTRLRESNLKVLREITSHPSINQHVNINERYKYLTILEINDGKFITQ